MWFPVSSGCMFSLHINVKLRCLNTWKLKSLRVCRIAHVDLRTVIKKKQTARSKWQNFISTSGGKSSVYCQVFIHSVCVWTNTYTLQTQKTVDVTKVYHLLNILSRGIDRDQLCRYVYAYVLSRSYHVHADLPSYEHGWINSTPTNMTDTVTR